MEIVTVPPSPNWYESNILACAPDNTLIFGSRNNIIILEDTGLDIAANIRSIPRAHSQRIISVNLNKSWGQPRKLIVSVSEDKSIKIWDADSGKKQYSHHEHLSHGRVIGATFAGNDRVISVSEEGNIVIWNLTLNETKVVKDLIGSKVVVTCISTCPHAGWLTAFGLKNGLVVVTDLRKSGKVLYKMRGHDKAVISLSWCPVPINIFAKNPHNYVGPKKSSTDIKKQENIEVAENPEYLQECENLKKEILGVRNGTTEEISTDVKNGDENLAQKIEKTDDTKNIKSTEEVLPQEMVQQITENTGQESVVEIVSDKDIDNIVQEDVNETEPIHANDKEASTENLLNELINDLIKKTAVIENEETVKIESENNSTKAEETGKEADTEHLPEDKNTCPDEKKEPDNKHISEEEEEPRKEFLLASSARENNIYIWRAGTDGRMQTFLTVPSKTNSRKGKTANDKIWITLCWISPTVLLSSSKSSELLTWTLPKPLDNSKLFTIVHKDHHSLLFSIAAPVLLQNEVNWKESIKTHAWTTSMDRLLLKTSISSERTNLACYSTIGATVQCLQLSPLDPNRLAIGTADGFIKIWDMSRPYAKHVIMTNFYQKIQSKVSAIAWHPVNELLLAFGTTEGRIGFLEVNNTSKAPILLKQYFKSEVYKLEWAPINGDRENFGLYAIAEGNLALFDIKRATSDPIIIDKPDGTFIYSLAWKPDYSTLLLTTKNGFLIVYSPALDIICKHYSQHRINDIIWHPNVACNKENNWFAAICNAKTVVVFDFNAESGNNDKNIVNTYIHTDMINSVSWSPYEDSHILMACEIGIAQIWDVLKNQILSTFINPYYDSVTTAVFSPMDQNLVISGAKDNTLRVWNILEHPPIDEKEIINNKKKILKEILDETNAVETIEQPSEEVIKVKKVTSKSYLLPNFYTAKSSFQVVEDLKKLLRWKENPASVETNIGDNCQIDILNVFGTEQAMMNLISLNEVIHKQKGKYTLSTQLSLFRGDVNTAIKEAIEEKRVDLEIIALAPMVSPKLWQVACETYANQLADESNSDPIKIAMFYLACHKVEKAVDTLSNAYLFREALALAKCRLLGEEVINTIIEKWATYCVQNGNFEIAAQCNIFLGKYEQAASVLFRRSDVALLKFASELAEKIGNNELHAVITQRYNAFNSSCDNNIDLPTIKEVVLTENKDMNGTHEENLVHETNVINNTKDDNQVEKEELILNNSCNQINDDLMKNVE